MEIKLFLKEIITKHGDEIEKWFSNVFGATAPFFYNSVDIRHSGFKIAPVDTNLFPGGFNNLSDSEEDRAVLETKNYLAKFYPKTSRILLIAEDHTRNLYYLENVAVILRILTKAGIETRLTSLHVANEGKPVTLVSKKGTELNFLPVNVSGKSLNTNDGFVPDIILINNDLSSGEPEILSDISQTIIPPPDYGWYRRRKTSHFEVYNNIAREFAHKFDFDPWLINTIFYKCGSVNFKEQQGLSCVAKYVDEVIARIQKKYNEYGIKEQPYVFIKSDKGTYGMGIMTARSGEEVVSLNKEVRNKMNVIKQGEINNEVIIQEGVPTIDKIEGYVSEPMIYLIGGKQVGCIHRINTIKDSYDNLNAKGMQFLSMEKGEGSNCKIFGLISRLAAYSAAWECYVSSYNI